MDKVSPATRSVPRADGLKTGGANSTITTPDPTFGFYSSGYRKGKDAVNPGQIFNKEVRNNPSGE